MPRKWRGHGHIVCSVCALFSASIAWACFHVATEGKGTTLLFAAGAINSLVAVWNVLTAVACFVLRKEL